MNKRITAIMMITICLLISGCGKSTKFDLPEKPIEFTINLYNKEYASIEYKGRIYVQYGTLKDSFPEDAIVQCLGYRVEDGKKHKDSRIYTLNGDEHNNYLCEFMVNAEMESPCFWRAINTKGKEISKPEYIESLNYDLWK